MAKRSRRRFTPEQKREAVALAKRLGNISQAARDLGLNASVLGRWVDKAEGRGEPAEPTQGGVEDEAQELKRLRKEVEVLRMERDFLKKAAAFFAEDPKRSS